MLYERVYLTASSFKHLGPSAGAIKVTGVHCKLRERAELSWHNASRTYKFDPVVRG